MFRSELYILKCKSCQTPFSVRPEDEAYYKKIALRTITQNFEIPAPTHCPRCRERRRLAYRNERNLYRRKSSLSDQEMISIFRPDSPYTIYTKEEWWSDNWDPIKYAQDPDLTKPFFDQFHELLLKVPRPPLINNKATNSEYCNFADENKNCYMVTSANRNEDSFYSWLMVENKDVVDCLWNIKNQLCYECIDCQNCYNINYAQNCKNCVDSSYLLNCQGLNNCLLCVNLKNKRYHIANKPVTKEEYERMKNENLLEKFNQIKEEFNIRRSNILVSCEDCVGNNIFNSKNVYYGFDIYDSEDCAYLHDNLDSKDCYDICFADGVELCYESTSLIGYGYRFTNFCRDSYDLFYCDNCHGCKNCFGCAGLRQKQYCIFNRQYEREEYEIQVARLVAHMIETGEWGEFFPERLSIFPYKDTLANDYFPVLESHPK